MSTISTSGIAPSSVIRAEHVLRVINALSNNANNDILISGSLIVTGSTSLSGSLNVTGEITGSLFGTSSYATNASLVSKVDNTSSANDYLITFISGEAGNSVLNIDTSRLSYRPSTNTLTVDNLEGNASTSTTSSYAINAESSSYALTASYALNTGTSINTGSFATTGSNQFSGSQTITGSIIIADSDLSLSMNQNFIVFENLNSPNDIGIITRLGSTYSEGSNTQAFLFPSNPTGGYKTITLPNDTGTVALTHNTAATGSNTFIGNQTVTGSVNITSVLTLTPTDPLPSGQPTGSITVSGSGVDCKPYFWNGATWVSMI